MLKILLIFLVVLDSGIAVLLILGIISSINAGGGSVLFPGLGLIVALPLVLGVVLIIEIVLVGISITLYRHIKHSSGKLT